MIFNIQKFCIHDGPGIRTTVFLKGCPLKCIWCHNPESQSPKPEIMFYEDKCVKCGNCASVCGASCHIFKNGMHLIERTDCVGCFKCTELNCGALEKAGKEITSEEILADVMKDKIFYENSGGGLTLSGGEPMYQFDFSSDILKKAKENGIHTAIETCGFAPADKIKEISRYVDLFLFDFKETNPVLHKQYTGADNGIVMNNLSVLNELKKDIILRCPIIPGFNDRQEHFDGICETANKFEHILHIELEPYHRLGENKYASLGRTGHTFSEPSSNEKECWLEIISHGTDKKVIVQ